MKPEETNALVKHRIEQAQTALHDAKVLMDSDCSPSSMDIELKGFSTRKGTGNE
jgi:hypothetical protein